MSNCTYPAQQYNRCGILIQLLQFCTNDHLSLAVSQSNEQQMLTKNLRGW